MSSYRKDYTKFSKPSLHEEKADKKETKREEPTEPTEPTESTKDEPKTTIGKVTAKRLNIREKPDIGSSILCVAEANSELMIEEDASDEWFKVCTVLGVEGYCMKKFVDINK